ncbi:DNA ligase [Striga asiatica]|uniref:DNA ligase n=1 Tax=Striga asiatica TaxID=4170 RepID=A0A5A7Q2P7_STRAF|nr:DNA ligase [Striga asiatica]
MDKGRSSREVKHISAYEFSVPLFVARELIELTLPHKSQRSYRAWWIIFWYVWKIFIKQWRRKKVSFASSKAFSFRARLSQQGESFIGCCSQRWRKERHRLRLLITYARLTVFLFPDSVNRKGYRPAFKQLPHSRIASTALKRLAEWPYGSWQLRASSNLVVKSHHPGAYRSTRKMKTESELYCYCSFNKSLIHQDAQEGRDVQGLSDLWELSYRKKIALFKEGRKQRKRRRKVNLLVAPSLPLVQELRGVVKESLWRKISFKDIPPSKTVTPSEAEAVESSPGEQCAVVRKEEEEESAPRTNKKVKMRAAQRGDNKARTNIRDTKTKIRIRKKRMPGDKPEIHSDPSMRILQKQRVFFPNEKPSFENVNMSAERLPGHDLSHNGNGTTVSLRAPSSFSERTELEHLSL